MELARKQVQVFSLSQINGAVKDAMAIIEAVEAGFVKCADGPSAVRYALLSCGWVVALCLGLSCVGENQQCVKRRSSSKDDATDICVCQAREPLFSCIS